MSKHHSIAPIEVHKPTSKVVQPLVTLSKIGADQIDEVLRAASPVLPCPWYTRLTKAFGCPVYVKRQDLGTWLVTFCDNRIAFKLVYNWICIVATFNEICHEAEALSKNAGR